MVLLVLLVGCAGEPPAPLDLPVAIHLAPEIANGERAGLEAAVDEWHAALGIAPVVAIDEATDGCGVFVAYGDAQEFEGRTWLAYTLITGECTAIIHLRPGLTQDFRAVFAHELGHLFIGTVEHSDDENSIMWPKYGAYRVITDDDVAKVITRLPKGGV